MNRSTDQPINGFGTGLVDIPAALRAAQETGVKHYFIEDEAVDAAQQIPKSLRFLDSMTWQRLRESTAIPFGGWALASLAPHSPNK